MAQSNYDQQNLKLQLETARKNLLFVQDDHANLLKDLHEEIDLLKNKCQRLQFSLDVENITSVDEDRYIARINALESEVVHWCQECKRLQDHLQYAEDVVSNLESALAKQYQQSEREINSKEEKINTLEKELAQKSRTISYLMAELHQHRSTERAEVLSKSLNAQSFQNSGKTSPSPIAISLKDPSHHPNQNFQSLPNNYSKKIQSSLEKDKKARAMSILEKSWESKSFQVHSKRDSRHSSVTRLPPIVKIPRRVSSSPSDKSSASRNRPFVRQQLRLTEPELNIETLAIDGPISSGGQMQPAD